MVTGTPLPPPMYNTLGPGWSPSLPFASLSSGRATMSLATDVLLAVRRSDANSTHYHHQHWTTATFCALLEKAVDYMQSKHEHAEYPSGFDAFDGEDFLTLVWQCVL